MSTYRPLQAPAQILLEDKKSGFGFARHNARPPKPRNIGVTEIRGPYYSVMGKRYLEDILETMGYHVDGLKFAGGSFSFFPEDKLKEMIDLAHQHHVYVSTGGWIEHILLQSDPHAAIDRYLQKCEDLNFRNLGGFSLRSPVHSSGLIAKPECGGIQFGAGGDTASSSLSALGTSDPSKMIDLCKRSRMRAEGITENVEAWRTDVIQRILKELPAEKVMFEAADPEAFNWYVKEFGTDVNLFVDHSQIVQLSCLREGIWGQADTFGSVVNYKRVYTHLKSLNVHDKQS
ncbi:hypothetical protein B0T10DRAFT_533443 [Thelonectria olida]|uniref:Sulfonate biosynthesis enzyme n=1 Tax=Thelonectria olida TaxID=1576542 RepID=A0A9P8VRP5_9HYPO|nr:hypothetical protein B0T10DRAFT_533443 [Thelonectria olida]